MDTPNTNTPAAADNIEIDLHKPGDWKSVLCDVTAAVEELAEIAAIVPDDDEACCFPNPAVLARVKAATGHLAVAILRFLTIKTVQEP